jgi:hypothetical protein
MAIGVLAVLGNAPPASAAGARHNGLPRSSRPASETRGTHFGRASQSVPDPSRRPAPRHSSRTAPRPVSHRPTTRGKFGGQTATLNSIQDSHPQMIAWRIGAAQSIGHSYMDDLVNSGRGPPRAGPQLFVSRVCHPTRRCAPCPASDSQVVLSLQTPEPQLLSQLSNSQSNSFPLEGLFGPPRAVRFEGTAARLHLPSLGESS